MPDTVFVLLLLTCTFTAIVSAVLGMGGGILLLAVLYSLLPWHAAVPLHAAIQLTSNFTRVLAYIRHANWQIFARYTLGVFGGVALGCGVLYALKAFDCLDATEPWLKLFAGVFILGTVKGKAKKVPHAYPGSTYTWLGVLTAPVSMLMGATGPLIAPFFIRRDLFKEAVVATKAACQMSVHLLKVIAFSMFFPEMSRQLVLSENLIYLLIATVSGTIVGRLIMAKVSEGVFRRLYLGVIVVAALKIMLWDGVAEILDLKRLFLS